VTDYLWDGTGPRDPEIEHLEALLGRYRRRPGALSLPSAAPPRPIFPARRMGWALAAAALAGLLFFGVRRFHWSEGAPWRVASLGGAPQVAGSTITGEGRLGVGQMIETDATSRARVQVAHIGTLDLEPGTRLRLVNTRSRRHRVALEQGRIRARLWAPPFAFGVDTPAAQVFDLGCVFELSVESHGVERLRVLSGWVQIEDGERETLVPAGAAAEIRAGSGPGSAYYEDASPGFRSALATIDFDRDGSRRAAALDLLLAEARPRDALTLLALVYWLPMPERARVFDRAAELLPLPSGATREGILGGDGAMLSGWWDRLGLPDVKRWWIHWKDALW